jgi:hypothetical protein
VEDEGTAGGGGAPGRQLAKNYLDSRALSGAHLVAITTMACDLVVDRSTYAVSSFFTLLGWSSKRGREAVRPWLG